MQKPASRILISIIILLLLIVAIGTGYLLYEYRKLSPDLTYKKADYSMTAKKLSEDFHLNEGTATERYLGKIIEIKGPIREIIREKDILMIGDSTFPVMISCALKAGSERIIGEDPLHGDIVLRGICTGYLLDVQLNNAVIIKIN